LVRISVRPVVILTEVVSGILAALFRYARVGQDSFIPSPFKFIIHQSPALFTLYIIDTASEDKLNNKKRANRLEKQNKIVRSLRIARNPAEVRTGYHQYTSIG
jgi:hypothetical protein